MGGVLAAVRAVALLPSSCVHVVCRMSKQAINGKVGLMHKEQLALFVRGMCCSWHVAALDSVFVSSEDIISVFVSNLLFPQVTV